MAGRALGPPVPPGSPVGGPAAIRPFPDGTHRLPLSMEPDDKRTMNDPGNRVQVVGAVDSRARRAAASGEPSSS